MTRWFWLRVFWPYVGLTAACEAAGWRAAFVALLIAAFASAGVVVAANAAAWASMKNG